MTSTIDFQKARATAYQNAKTALRALPAGATLHTVLANDPVACTDSDNIPDSTPVSIQSGYWVENLAAANNKTYITNLVDFWQARGWKIHDDNRPGDQFVSLTSTDGYSITFQLTVDGARLSLSTSTPCVKPLDQKAATGGG